MKLGTQTGSLINHLHARGTRGQPEPVVGMGVTILHWTDRSVGTIVAVEPHKQGWRITVQEDEAKLVSGPITSESQRYEYTPNPEGYVQYFQCDDPDGQWVEVRLNTETNRWNKVKGSGLLIGRRDAYRDPSF